MAIFRCRLVLLSDSRFPSWSYWTLTSSDIDTMVLTTTRWRLPGSACKKKRLLECCHLSLPSPPAACAGPVCNKLYILVRPDTQFVCMCVFFCDILWPEVLMSCRHLIAPCSARALGQACSTMVCIHLVIVKTVGVWAKPLFPGVV